MLGILAIFWTVVMEITSNISAPLPLRIVGPVLGVGLTAILSAAGAFMVKEIRK